MKKSLPLAMLMQLLALIFACLIDFELWIHGVYCIAASAAIMVFTMIAGLLFLPLKKQENEAVLTVFLVWFFLLLLPACLLPKLEFAYQLSQENEAYRIEELLLDPEFEMKLSEEEPPFDTEIGDVGDVIADGVSEAVLSQAFLNLRKSNYKSQREFYQDRRYEFILTPIFYVFLLILIGIVRIYSKPKRKPSDE